MEGTPKPRRRWFRFSIREMLLVMAIVALSVGWWVDHRKLSEEARFMEIHLPAVSGIRGAKSSSFASLTNCSACHSDR